MLTTSSPVVRCHPRTKGRPTAAVPFCYAPDEDAPRRREPASRIEIIAQHGEGVHIGGWVSQIAHTRTEGRPIVPVPFGDIIGRIPACRGENTSAYRLLPDTARA